MRPKKIFYVQWHNKNTSDEFLIGILAFYPTHQYFRYALPVKDALQSGFEPPKGMEDLHVEYSSMNFEDLMLDLQIRLVPPWTLTRL